MLFKDRTEAGQHLAKELSAYANRSDVIVLGLPRGGVPVAFEVAIALNVPLDIFIVRKLGVPGQEELAMGAIASGGVRVINEELVRSLDISNSSIERVTNTEQLELERRERLYRGDISALTLRDHTVILVDDGLATGYTMRAAVTAVRQQHPAAIVVAVPVAAPETCDEFKTVAEVVVCAVTPKPFYAVGLWYKNFSQTTDEEVRTLLDKDAQQQLVTSP